MNQEVVSVAAETDQEECARLMERYDLKNLPVVDENRRLLGVILVDDLVDVLADEATEDMYRMARIGRERLFGPLQTSIRRRLPWLFLNLGTAILAALVISLFESTIAKVVALAVFLPVIAGQGGIGGTQTLTLMIRSIAVGDLPEKQASRLLVRELLLGIIHGVLLGLAVGLLAFVWKGPFMLGVVVGVAMLGNMVVAGLAGGAVPLALRVLRLDPALGSAVIVTTITDVVGFFLFLGIAALLVNSLV
jgi:magnesium transporter